MISIILAGGKGKRMNSPLPKVLHKICGKPMLQHIIRAISSLKEVDKIIVVVGYKKNLIRKILPENVKTAVQRKLLGTADAVKSCRSLLRGYKGDVLIICGDIPLISSRTLLSLIKKHKTSKADVTIITTFVNDPTGYGRMLRDKNCRVLGIIEEKDTTTSEKKIKEINSGIYCFNWAKLNHALTEVKINNLKGEYYLTDVIKIFKDKAHRIETFLAKDYSEIMGVDTTERLKLAERTLKWRRKCR